MSVCNNRLQEFFAAVCGQIRSKNRPSGADPFTLSVYRRTKLVSDSLKLSGEKPARLFTISDGRLIIDLGWRDADTDDED